MTDRELLEKAAKAAGIDLQFEGNHESQPGYYGDFKGLPQWETWNPVIDDGDALRLAVKLEILVKYDRPAEVYATYEGSEFEFPEEDLEHNGDRFAAARRSIVRAAAAIGESDHG